MAQQLTIALAGNPNAGKTTLFNTLTGSRQHVGNYPGVTVEKKEGIHLCDGRPLTIVDLPGTYSLTAYSVEEVVARDFLVTARPQVIVNIVDAANIERNLYLTCQFLEMGVPMVIALNMIDVAKDRGIDIDAGRLAQLLGVEVVPIIARSGLGTAELMRAAIRVADTHQEWQPRTLSYGDDLDSALLHMEARIKAAGFLTDTYPARWLAIKYLENDEQIMGLGHRTDTSCAADLTDMAATVTNHLQATVASYPEAMIADHRYGFIKSLLKQGVMSRTYDTDRLYTSDRIDRVLTNRFLGPLCMMAVLLGLYHFTFTYSQLPVSWLGNFFAWLASTATHLLPAGPLRSLLVSGIINGVGGVLGFVPLIMFMFMGIAFLEDSGYLARVAFMMDRIFRIFGLHGSSVMPYIVSGGIAGGCAVPGVMATRTLRSPKERMATLLTVPFMNCGAKLPVLALLTAIFFAEYQAHMLLLLTLIAWAVALMAAKFLRLTVLRGESTPFV
ncbi:MAG: ferrous iron transport protein B, partial [Desulfobulbaceae bacterium]|nr:ferrous iron transport protein B [Desulfobulbaceae bacterium]